MKRSSAFVAVAIVAGALRTLSAQAPQPSAPVRFVLPNGLRVWVQEEHSRPTAVVQTVYKVGTLNEGPGTTGIAHFVEHMMYRSMKGVLAEDIYQWNDRIGGRWTGSTSQTTNYGEVVPSWALDHALYVTSQRMGHAAFDSTEFVRERNMVLTEANGFSRTDAATAFRNAMLLTSFELHPYRYNSTTWAWDNLAATREQLQDWYKQYIGPNNAILVVVGDVKVDEVRRLVEKHFGPLSPAPGKPGTTIVEPPQRAEKRVSLSYPGVRKHVELMFRSPQASHADAPVLPVLNRILSTRVQRAVSATGGADATTAYEMRPYPFVYRVTAYADSAFDLERLVVAIQTEIDRIKRDGVTAEELSAARVDPTGGRGAGGRGGRGGGGGRGGDGGNAVPGARTTIWNGARNPVLADLASALSAREVFPHEISPELRERVLAAERNVTSADLQRYADRWLRTSQRTVGFLVPGRDDFMPQWSNGRPVVGERLEVPPMVTPPAKRKPTPVPARALEPLPALSIPMARKALSNGAVIRVARNSGTTGALLMRINFGGASDGSKAGLSLIVARLIAGDPALAAAATQGLTTSGATAIANDGYFDIQMRFAPAEMAAAIAAAGRALRTASFEASRLEAERARLVADYGTGVAGPAGGGRGGQDVAALARRTVTEAVSPLWRYSAPGAIETAGRITVKDVNDFAAQRVVGGAVIVSIAAPVDTTAIFAAATTAFSSLRGRGPGLPASVRIMPLPAPSQTALAPTEDRVAAGSETQVTIFAALPGTVRGSRERRALDLLNAIVGLPLYGGRLGWIVTRGGLAYSTQATTTYGVNTGHIVFNTRVDSRNLAATIQCLRETIAATGELGVEEWELNEAKAFTLGRTLNFGPWNGSDEVTLVGALTDSEFDREELLDMPAFSRSVLSVTLAEVNAVAKKYYRADRLKVMAIGALPPAGDRSPFAAGTFRRVFER